ncbi:HepT-like ribonuclease domain-containing protein [Nautilia sp.]
MKKPKEDIVYLKHINEFCEDLKEYFYEIGSFEEFSKNKMYQDAVFRKIEIIGEAVSNISNDLKSRYSDIPWQQIKNMRNVIIHGYFGIDKKLVWNLLINEIPVLHEQIKKIIKDLS